MFKKISLICIVIVLFGCTEPECKLSLPSFFSNHMVLQRGVDLPIWGHARPGSIVTVEILDQTFTTKASRDGTWRVNIGSYEAGGPYTMIVKNDGGVATLENILIGDVWIAAGQSNMRFRVKDSSSAEQEVENFYKYPRIRFYTVDEFPQPQITDNPKGRWGMNHHINVQYFSAVAYSFAKEIYDSEQVPIGIISSAYGNTKLENWVSKRTLSHFSKYKDVLEKFEPTEIYLAQINFYNEPGFEFKELVYPNEHSISFVTWLNGRKLTRRESGVDSFILKKGFIKDENKLRLRIKKKENEGKDIEAFLANLDGTKINADKGEFFKVQDWTLNKSTEANYPSVVYNSYIAPFISLPIKGMLWYQGESDVFDSENYKEMFKLFISELREDWGMEFPLFSVQFPDYKTDRKKLKNFRKIQYELSQEMPNHYLISAIGLHDANFSIHPKNKKNVGIRLANAAKHYVYKSDKELGDIGPIQRN